MIPRSIGDNIRRELRKETLRMSFGRYKGKLIARMVWNAEERSYLQALQEQPVTICNNELANTLGCVTRCLELYTRWNDWKRARMHHNIDEDLPRKKRRSKKTLQNLKDQENLDKKITELVEEILKTHYSS